MNKLLRWFIDNPIAANLLMALIVVGGLSTLDRVDKRFFPERIINRVQIDVVYPGASPRQSEEQIVNRIEEAIRDLNGIDGINSTASEGGASISIEVRANYDSQRLLNDIKARVDALPTLPVAAERPQISEQQFRSRVISLALAGDIGERPLKELAQQLREQLLKRDWIPLVELRQPRDYELSIELSAAALQKYQLSFEQVAATLRAASLNLSAGSLRSASGNIQIQARGQAYSAADFAAIPLINQADGGQLLLGEVAAIRDGFVEEQQINRFDGQPSLSLDIYVSERADIVKTSAAAQQFVSDVQSQLPPGVSLTLWRDQSREFRDRMNTLIDNGFGGLLLIFIILLLFLRPLLAFWVCTGIATSLLGAIWLLPVIGISLNMVSLFAFIMILGIVVDDAIIVGESIYSEQARSGAGAASSHRGAAAVTKPVLFAVTTTMIFFLPFLNLPPDMAEPYNLGAVVLVALSFSLLDSLLILPAHLAKMPAEQPGKLALLAPLERLRGTVAKGLATLTQRYYRPLLQRALDRRGLTLSSFIAALLIISSLLFGGWLRSSFFPIVPLDFIEASFSLREGLPFSAASELGQRVERAAEQLKAEVNSAAPQPYIGHIESAINGDGVKVSMALLNVEQRPFDIDWLKQRWLADSGSLTAVRDYQLQSSLSPNNKAIELQLSAADSSQLRQLTSLLEESLASYPGVYDIRNELDAVLPEYRVSLRPGAETLGISLDEVISQLRQAYFGEELQRIPRRQEDVKVMLRYPRAEREQLDQLQQLRIRSNGRDIPLSAIAELTPVYAAKQLRHIDGQAATTVTAEVEAGYSGAAISRQILQAELPQWQQRFAGASVKLEGEQERQGTFVAELAQMGILALILIYGLFAVAFRSYWQPLLILSAIPFGLMGAILGHLLFDREISMFSMLGVVAVAGVVVNDNLVMVDRINHLRASGMALRDAIVNGACDRFRPILLTSVTTFVGMVPIMMESSVQAQFLIPMVLSLAFGVLMASGVTLLFVPTLCALLHPLLARKPAPQPPTAAIATSHAEPAPNAATEGASE